MVCSSLLLFRCTEEDISALLGEKKCVDANLTNISVVKYTDYGFMFWLIIDTEWVYSKSVTDEK